jgi:eukaryotic-like serine/threonine-protein kinase
MPLENTANDARTLAQRLAEGNMAVPEALRCAMLIADALRKMHDAGTAHGALSPRSIVLRGGGVELLPASTQSAGITPYSAPETLEGRATDSRSDIFSFGAVVYELLTGRRAFSGEGAELAAALASAVPPRSGSPMVDRVVTHCLAKDPAERWPRMQKVLMELKLLTVAARRSETPGPSPRQEAETAAIRAGMQQFEERVSARLQAHEKNMADLQRAATDAVEALRGQLAALDSQLSTAVEQASRPGPDLDGLEERVTSRIVRGLEAAGERIARLEQSIEAAREHSAQFEVNVAADLRDVQAALSAQDAAIQSARSATAQTDDLVERVVEALESLQSAVLDDARNPSLGEADAAANDAAANDAAAN